MKDFKIKEIVKRKIGCKYKPLISISGDDLTKSGFEMGDKALIEFEQNKIIIRRTKPKKNVILLRQMILENPDIQ